MYTFYNLTVISNEVCSECYNPNLVKVFLHRATDFYQLYESSLLLSKKPQNYVLFGRRTRKWSSCCPIKFLLFYDGKKLISSSPFLLLTSSYFDISSYLSYWTNCNKEQGLHERKWNLSKGECSLPDRQKMGRDKWIMQSLKSSAAVTDCIAQ